MFAISVQRLVGNLEGIFQSESASFRHSWQVTLEYYLSTNPPTSMEISKYFHLDWTRTVGHLSYHLSFILTNVWHCHNNYNLKLTVHIARIVSCTILSPLVVKLEHQWLSMNLKMISNAVIVCNLVIQIKRLYLWGYHHLEYLFS